MRLDCLAPFPLRSATLPLTGDRHPLRREFNKWMSWGNASTLLFALLALGAYLSLPHREIVPEVTLPPFDIDLDPPVITIDKPGPVSPPVDPLSKNGIIEPVPELPPEQIFTIPPVDQIASVGTGEILKGGGERVIEAPEGAALPAPDVFVFVEVLPELLRMEAPVYPDLAREANIEGTVVLRILVSKEGKVLDCIVLSGNPMLVDAAVTAARTAVFSPALQQHKPVAVWVQVPIVFSLK